MKQNTGIIPFCRYLSIAMALSYALITNSYAQSGRVKLEIRVDSILVNVKGGDREAGDYEYRFDIWLENAELELEMNDVENIPAKRAYSSRKITYKRYERDFEATIRLDAWEEDGSGDNDNEYNSNDDAYCSASKIVSFNRREPETWYRSTLRCSNDYRIYFSYKWSAPTPPDPAPVDSKICKDEVATQLRAESNPSYSMHIDSYNWKVLYKYRRTIYPNASECEAQCRDNYFTIDRGCYYPCLNTPKGEEDAYAQDNSIDVSKQNGSTLSYATSKQTVYVQYQEVYKNGTTSPWSKETLKTHDFYTLIQPSAVDTYEDGGSATTNLICGGKVKLKATHPNGKIWSDHKFYWYRQIQGVDANPVFIRSSTLDSIVYNFPKSAEGRSTQFLVQTERVECNEPSGLVRSAPVYLFDPVPSSFAVNKTNTGRIQYRATSCAEAKDGKIRIYGRGNEANQYYYYNVALKNPDKSNGIEPTTILSSPRMKGSNTFTFPDDIPFPGEAETELSEEEWRQYTRIGVGTYTVQVINGGGDKGYELDETFENEGYCFKTFEIEVEPKPALSIDEFIVTRPVRCHNGNKSRIKVDYSGGRTPYTVKLFRSDQEEFTTSDLTPEQEVRTYSGKYTFNNLSAGYYKARVSLANAVCFQETTSSLELSQPEPLSFTEDHVATSRSNGDYRGAWTSCPGVDDAYLTVTPQGGNLNSKYTATLLENGTTYQGPVAFQSTYTFDNLPPGQYSVVVADSCGAGPLTVAEYGIHYPPTLIIDSLETHPITCYGVANGEVRVSARGGTGDLQFRVDGGEWQAEDQNDEAWFVGLDSGQHVIEAKDMNQCEAPEPFRFHLKYPTPLQFTLDSLTMPLCHGGSDGKLFIRPFGGDTITQSYRVALRSLDRPTVVSPASSDYSRAILENSNIVFDDLPSAHYEVTVTDASEPRYSCSRVVDTVFLPQPTPVVVQAVAVTMPSCAGATDGSVSIRASGGTPGVAPDYYYSIDGVHYVAPNESGVAVFTELAAGHYTFYAVDAHHEDYSSPAFLSAASKDKLCTGSLDFTLDEPDLITVYTSVSPVVCYGTASGSITVDDVTGGRAGYTYEWAVLDPSTPTSDGYRLLTPTDPRHLTDVPHGTYRLIVRDVAGCRATVVREVTQPEIPLAVDAVQSYFESCTGTTDGKLQVLAQGGYPPYEYQLDGGAYRAVGFFDGLPAGAYMLTVRDRQGCEVQHMASVVADDLTVEVADQLPATVGSDDGLLRLHVTGGQNKRYYLDGVLSTTGAEFSGLPAGTHTVAVEYNEQCRWEQVYAVAEVAAPVPALRVTTDALHNVSCHDAQDGSVSVAVRGGVSPYALQWNDPQAQTTPEATGLAKGPYVLTVTDAAGVTLDYPVTIDGPETFEIINAAAVSPACYRGTDGSAEVTVVGGTAPYTYAWDDPQQQTTARVSQLPAGTYTVAVTDQNGCALSQTLTVAATPAPDDVLEPQAITLCTGQSVTVDAGTDWSTYQWSSDNSFSSTASRIDIDQAGRYFLTVTNALGCVAYDTLELVTTDNLIDAEFLLPTEITAGDTVVLTEVSWPTPDQTAWLYDKTVITHRSDGEKEYVIFPEPGTYEIEMAVMVGNCMDVVTKEIIVSEATAEATVENGRLGYHPKNEYLLYPNPNQGKFTLQINIEQAYDLRVSVYDPLFKYRYHQKVFPDTRSIEKSMDLTHLKHGVYSLIIETPAEIKIIRFVIR